MTQWILIIYYQKNKKEKEIKEEMVQKIKRIDYVVPYTKYNGTIKV